MIFLMSWLFFFLNTQYDLLNKMRKRLIFQHNEKKITNKNGNKIRIQKLKKNHYAFCCFNSVKLIDERMENSCQLKFFLTNPADTVNADNLSALAAYQWYMMRHNILKEGNRTPYPTMDTYWCIVLIYLNHTNW